MRLTGHNGIQLLPVPGGHVFDIGEIFQPAFNLERTDPGLGQSLQIGALIHILQRQQMLIFRQCHTVTVFQRAGNPAQLRAFTPVGTATGHGMTDIALTTVTDAQRAMNKELQLNRSLLCNRTDLIQRQFARQHHPGKTDILQETDFLRCPVIQLCTGMQRHWRQIQL